MEGSPTNRGSDRVNPSISDRAQACISKLGHCPYLHINGYDVMLESRLVDLHLWAVQAGEDTASHKILLVELYLIMFHGALDNYLSKLNANESTEKAIENIDYYIENLSTIENTTVNHTGNVFPRRCRVDSSFNPEDYAELRRHLECIILLRPSSAGLPERPNPSDLTPVQQRLIEANLMRRHRSAIAQRRSQEIQQADRMPIDNLTRLDGGGDFQPSDPDQTGMSTPNARKENQERTNTEVGSTAAEYNAASLPEKSTRNSPGSSDAQGTMKTPVTMLNSRNELPMPPSNPSGSLTTKCPCCCQEIRVDEMLDTEKWRSVNRILILSSDAS